MGFFTSLAQLSLDAEITAFAISANGKYVAIGMEGMLGLYSIESSGKLLHHASFYLPGSKNQTVTNIAFHETQQFILIQTSTGAVFELCVFEKIDGMLIERKLLAKHN